MDIYLWNEIIKQHKGDKYEGMENFVDHWDDAILKTECLNSQRTKKGLYNLHWLQINELPHALNI